jgi:tetraacyldisaccharide 4'-kinase
MLAAAGRRPVLLSRGYGGSLHGPARVEPGHRAADVGDEPLLLARAAPTIVARDRVSGAQAAVAAGADVIVMDDGLQNPSLAKDLSVLVVDGKRGFGNGRVFPAGPLRAPMAAQWPRVDAVIVIGRVESMQAPVVEAERLGKPVFHASLAPDPDAVARLKGQKVLAFAGIGDPEKFFATLAEAGVAVTSRRSFADHHRYTGAEARALCEAAEGLTLVSTEKDLARLHGDAETAALAARTQALPVRLSIDDAEGFRQLVLDRIAV